MILRRFLNFLFLLSNFEVFNFAFIICIHRLFNALFVTKHSVIARLGNARHFISSFLVISLCITHARSTGTLLYAHHNTHYILWYKTIPWSVNNVVSCPKEEKMFNRWKFINSLVKLMQGTNIVLPKNRHSSFDSSQELLIFTEEANLSWQFHVY